MTGVIPARAGDRVSGVGPGPCSDVDTTVTARSPAPALDSSLTPAEKFASRQLPDPPGPVRSEAERYVRMLRPFPVRRLAEVLYPVQGEAAALGAILQNLQIDWPQSVGSWTEALYYLLDCLDGLAERAIEARPAIERMLDQADVDAERAAVALRALTGLAPC
jgi:hypothetical protein